MGIYAALTDQSKDAVCAAFAGKGFAEFKGALADLCVAKLAPIAEEMRRLRQDPAYVDSILRDGAERADAIARPILREVQDIVGFLRP